MSMISKIVKKAQAAGKVGESQSEIEQADSIIRKHGANIKLVPILLMGVQALGFGRNRETSAALRAVADLIDSTIETAESIEARLAGKLQ